MHSPLSPRVVVQSCQMGSMVQLLRINIHTNKSASNSTRGGTSISYDLYIPPRFTYSNSITTLKPESTTT